MDKIYNKIAWLVPRKFLYWCIIRAWAIVTTEKYKTYLHDEVTWYMVCDYMLESKQNNKG